MLSELDQLAAANPAHRTPALAVTAEDRSRLLAAILSCPQVGPADAAPRRSTPRGNQRRVTALALGVVSLAAVATVTRVVSVPGLTYSAPRANAALEALAVAAGNAPADAVGPAQYRHLIAHLAYGGEQMAETWIAADGRTWRWDTYMGPKEYFAFPAPHGFGTSDPSPAFLASLPTSSAALSRYLRHHASGSHSTNEAVFIAVGDMLRAGLAAPQLRAAAVGVIEGLPHITTAEATDLLGRPALKITYKDPDYGPSALLFDRSSATLLGEEAGPGFRVTYTEDIADSVPADVLAHAHMPAAPPPGALEPSAQAAPSVS